MFVIFQQHVCSGGHSAHPQYLLHNNEQNKKVRIGFWKLLIWKYIHLHKCSSERSVRTDGWSVEDVSLGICNYTYACPWKQWIKSYCSYIVFFLSDILVHHTLFDASSLAVWAKYCAWAITIIKFLPHIRGTGWSLNIVFFFRRF